MNSTEMNIYDDPALAGLAAEDARKSPGVDDFLAACGASALVAGCHVDAVGGVLRTAAEKLRGSDDLFRALTREALISRLKAIGITSPASLADAAFSAPGKQNGAARDGIQFSNVEPWPDPVDGRELLDEMVSALRRYIVLAGEAAAAVALWCLHTHAAGAADVFPRLLITSPEKRCGKTRVQEVIEWIVPRPLRTGSITPAAVFRMIENDKPTLLIDEADTFLREREELRGILNSGYRVGGFVPRCEGEDNKVRAFRAWGPLSIASIGTLPDTIRDRSIEIEMRRKKPEEKVARFRVKSAKRELADLCRKAARWAKDNLEILAQSNPELPDGLNDRQADNWEPLLAIADLAGGVWPERARKAAIVLSGSDDVLDARIGPQLLADLREVFGTRPELWTKDILAGLYAMEERPWGEWSAGRGGPPRPMTARTLAKLLRPYKIRSQQLRIGTENSNGYTAESLADAWNRYAPGLGGVVSNPLQGLHADISTGYGDFYPLQKSECRGSEQPVTHCKIRCVEDVEDRNPPQGGAVCPEDEITPLRDRKAGRL